MNDIFKKAPLKIRILIFLEPVLKPIMNTGMKLLDKLWRIK